MASTLQSPPESSSPAPLVRRRPVARGVKVVDKIANFVIRTCGVGIIAVVALIFVFIGAETIPLFRSARIWPIFQQPLPPGHVPVEQVRALGVEEYESIFYYVDARDGVVRFFNTDRTSAGEFPLPALQTGGGRVTSAYRTPSRDKLFIGTSDGRVIVAEAKFSVAYGPDVTRTVRASLAQVAVVTVAEGEPIAHVHGRQNMSSADFNFAAATSGGRVFVGRVAEGEPPDEPTAIGGQFTGAITGLAIDADRNQLVVTTDSPRLYQYFVPADASAPYREYELPAQITALDYAIGEVALLFGFADGSVESWFGVREVSTDTLKPLHRIHSFERMPAPVTALAPSARDKGFAVGAEDGTVRLYFTTSERTMLTFDAGESVRHLAYAPKLTALFSLGRDGALTATGVHNPHPEVSLQTLFGKVHYEGYDEPAYVWQSTGPDDFESKLSLVPLTIGTLKGAFYGLLFAIPIAVFAALYTSQFMTPRLRGVLKPTVEIMAALPSVVLGFLAGLWLAPRLEEVMVGTLLSAFFVLGMVVAGSALWSLLPHNARRRVPPGFELVLCAPLVAIGFWLALQAGPMVEAAFFGGDYRAWVFETFDMPFDQRNSIVIGIAMGFAVIPIIFTISEDAFSNVPSSFKSGSYALGASRWQTAWRVIVPTASPGVFSAVMIGFGRAVGETMIVLMATGNTPILSFSPFNGFRALAPNIAVEIPEAPVGGTLYRVLFVSALLLFALTFLCNTLAEVVRQRLRQRYQAV